MIKYIMVFLAIVAGISLCTLQRFEEKKRRNICICFSILICILFVIYRIYSSHYEQSVLGKSLQYSILLSIPLHLCYACMVLMPIAFLTRKRIIFSLCYIIGPFAGITAIIFPGTDIDFRGPFEPSYILFLVVHLMLIVLGIGIASTGFYYPKFSDILKNTSWIIIGIIIIHIINNIMPFVLGEFSNYMYTMSPAAVPVLKVFYNIMPLPLLYLIVPLLIFTVLSVIRIFIFRVSVSTINKIRLRIKG